MDIPSIHTAPLDVLLYCHDGCGYGHAGRTVAIALAVRRMAPDARLLLVTGSSGIPELAAGAELDWVKLPSYRSAVRDGRTVSLPGFSGFESVELARLRSSMLADMVGLLHPRVVYVDHMPGGKKNELLPALEQVRQQGGSCVLGVRAVIGDNDAFWTDATREVVGRHYRSCLWFGDRRVHGDTDLARIRLRYAREPVPIGFVSRAQELDRRNLIPLSNAYGTVAFSWCDSGTAAVAESVAAAIATAVPGAPWNVYVGPSRGGLARDAVAQRFAGIPAVHVEEFHRSYLSAVRASSIAVTYGGYNTLTDLLWARTAAVVVARATEDGEQRLHAAYLSKLFGPAAVFLDSDADAQQVHRALQQHVRKTPRFPDIDLDGSTRAAAALLMRA